MDIVGEIVYQLGLKEKYIDNIRLQKYLWYTQKENIRFFGKPLFEDNFIMSNYGFYVHNVYKELSINGCCDLYYEFNFKNRKPAEIDNNTKIIINAVIKALNNKSTWKLVSLNQQELLYELHKDELLNEKEIIISNDELLKIYSNEDNCYNRK